MYSKYIVIHLDVAEKALLFVGALKEYKDSARSTYPLLINTHE